jgi:cbb3-type cytochrome oxidase subunit 3
MRDPLGAILLFVAIGCIVIAGCLAAGIWITFRP